MVVFVNVFNESVAKTRSKVHQDGVPRLENSFSSIERNVRAILTC